MSDAQYSELDLLDVATRVVSGQTPHEAVDGVMAAAVVRPEINRRVEGVLIEQQRFAAWGENG
jgi:hypothetical protein